MPVIQGRISAYASHTDVHVYMRMHPAIQVLVAIWLGAVGTACLMIVIGIITGSPYLVRSPGFVIPFVMFAFGFLMSHLAFRHEARKSREFLEQRLEAYEAPAI